MAEHLYFLEVPDYRISGTDGIVTKLGKESDQSLAERIREETDGKTPHLLCSPANRAKGGAEVLMDALGGSIEYVPHLWTGRFPKLYRYEMGQDLIEMLNREQSARTPEERESLIQQTYSHLEQEVAPWLQSAGIAPRVEGIDIPFIVSSISLRTEQRGSDKIIGAEATLLLNCDCNPQQEYVNALIKSRLSNPPLIVIAHLEFLSYICHDTFKYLQMPLKAYEDLKFDSDMHHGYHVTMPAENPQSWEIGLIER